MLSIAVGVARAMNAADRRVTSCWHPLAGVVVCAAATIGCAGGDRSGALVCQKQTRALLAAARANHVSMFGDLSDGTMPAYFTRTVVSLRRHTFTEVGADFDPDIDATGKRMAFASTRHNVHPDLYIKAIDGVAVTQLTADPAPEQQNPP